MRRSTRVPAKQSKPENEAQREPKSKKKRSENRHKHVRHKHNNHGEIDAICPFFAKIFNKRLSPDAYNGWIVRNDYSNRVPPKVRGKRSRQNDHKIYEFNACAVYKGPNRRRPNGGTKAFFARMKLDNETWPLLQHFVSLLADSFIYIRHIELTSRYELLNLLTDAMTPERGHLQCEEMHFYLEDNVQKFMSWLKNNVRCDKFQISDISGLDRNEELLNFFITGGHCTSALEVRYYDLSQDRSYIIVDLVQKFLDLKTCDEYELVDSIQYNSAGEIAEALKHKYTKFIVKVETANCSSPQIFQFVNKDIGKKMEFTTSVIDDDAEYCNGIAFDNPSDTHVLVSIEFENL
ncbi:hypothetical protein Ddc_14294 [Ditylenchus destructor]|nr:hypothetical protein Ddc_14294 [Ditylenchus destructor]